MEKFDAIVGKFPFFGVRKRRLNKPTTVRRVGIDTSGFRAGVSSGYLAPLCAISKVTSLANNVAG